LKIEKKTYIRTRRRLKTQLMMLKRST